jgi:SsrA-binding protein
MARKPATAKPRDAREAFTMNVGRNRRARHEYHVEETYEAGIELHGSEVKSLRQREVDFADSYARVDGGECWLLGLRLAPYRMAHVQVPDPVRRRRLLLKKREIARLQAFSDRSGYTLIPLEVYFKGSWAKVTLGVCRGKKEYDKREAFRAAQAQREIARVMKIARRR